ncbi:initiation factor 2 [Nemania sp. NC0429]|nr:initiation factor 2 [Nemania sp. NC0429]
MLRGRLVQRDGGCSVCAFCQYRLSPRRRPAPPRHHSFSATARCGAGDHDPSRLRQFRPLPLAQNLSTAAATNPDSRPLQRSTPPAGSSSLATPASRFTFARRPRDDLLDPHEAKARESLLAQQAARPPPPPPSQHPGVHPLVKARYVWDPDRQQSVERYLKAEAADASKPGGSPSISPGAIPARSLPRIEIGSEPPNRSLRSLRSQPDTKHPFAHRSTPESFFRRTLPDVPLSKAAPEVSLLRKLPAGDPAPSHPSSSRLASNNDLVTRGSPSSASPEPLPSGLSGLTGPRGLSASAADPAPSNPGPSATAFASLEAAGARDASIKAAPEGAVEGSGLSAQWGQLARKPTHKLNLENEFWANMQNTVARSQPKSADTQNAPSDTFDNSITRSPPRETAKTTFNNEITSSPPQERGRDQGVSRERYDDYDSGRGGTQQRKPFDRDQRSDKKRGGKRSGRGSRLDEDEREADAAWDRLVEKRRQKELRKAQREADRTEPIPIILPELISVMTFAKALKIKPDDFLEQLGGFGFEGVTLDSLMAGETAALVAQEYGYEPIVQAGENQDLKPRPPPEDPSILPPRPPVVTIMGHVDHGKTTILDYLRQSSVAAHEHGGITQHIGAFSVSLSGGKPITFLDTPGHAAFLTMRQRGANVTDIVVLVVAADDSIKPQTLEALNHARAAKVPIIVAINKIDKDGARVDAVKHDLAQAGVELEDFGGDIQAVCVSGKTGQGMGDLEESILTLSEILDHRAEIDGPAEGWVLESSLKPTGKVATVLVKRGTLRLGDYIAAGLTWAKIRQLRNEDGVDIEEAPPGTPVEILGWRDLPAAGDQVIQSPDEDRARTATSYREGLREMEKDAAEYENIAGARRLLQEKRAREKATSGKATGTDSTNYRGTGVQEVLLEEEDGTKVLNFIVKCDVHGSVEAVCAAIQEIGSNEVRPRILRSATGPISEFDVEHATTTKSILVNFATTTPAHVQRMAEAQGVRILDHTIIYHLVDQVKATLSEHLTPELTTRVVGEAEVLQVFPINTHKRFYKNIAGCRVRNGIVERNALYRVLRGGKVIFDGKLETLKHVKKDVMEMRKGNECGMGFEEFQDLQVGDQVQAYEEIRTPRYF